MSAFDSVLGTLLEIEDADERGEDEDEGSHIEGRHEARSPTRDLRMRRPKPKSSASSANDLHEALLRQFYAWK
jgi:hypothetical protein